MKKATATSTLVAPETDTLSLATVSAFSKNAIAHLANTVGAQFQTDAECLDAVIRISAIEKYLELLRSHIEERAINQVAVLAENGIFGTENGVKLQLRKTKTWNYENVMGWLDASVGVKVAREELSKVEKIAQITGSATARERNGIAIVLAA